MVVNELTPHNWEQHQVFTETILEMMTENVTFITDDKAHFHLSGILLISRTSIIGQKPIQDSLASSHFIQNG